jgi:hypothetical protein
MMRRRNVNGYIKTTSRFVRCNPSLVFDIVDAAPKGLAGPDEELKWRLWCSIGFARSTRMGMSP